MNNINTVEHSQRDRPRYLSLILQYIPFSLVIIRLCLSPLLLWDALDGITSNWFIFGFVLAFLSDIFDGVIARRIGVSTASLRQADSLADVCLYLCIGISAWLVHPDVITEFSIPLSLIILMQLIWLVVNLAKYGKPASYHTYSAKTWGVTLFIATIALFGFNYAGFTLFMMIAVGCLHTLEEIAMTLILPTWTHDVLSIVHARKIVSYKE
ncbi:CDP-alcohol phosphatidyltransferase family protein [Coleofasciculus sp. FACHB-1120]|uniref:CDP-alcohol phosphatidyltransferase family protein n=1 Tax=Coleofasciculus sp. FACHB-1120 TaxID=2692783 RepID=UPI001689ABAC|nr:CDP-alcohol phosphatidyltransferase family protein [Coleofasciculus sp. FACHB-1120]MBD2741516.1 CDP-alcohol phosphatidyltransferase family protein [Coleofasciculus sp. FACHB-1120]